MAFYISDIFLQTKVGLESKMTNLELKNIEQGNSGADTSIFPKQPPIATKKMVLADVQNDNRVLRNYRESSFPMDVGPIPMDGGPTAEKAKVSGTKRLIPESATSHPWSPLPDHTTRKEHLMHTTKNSECVPGNEKSGNNSDRNMSSPPLKRFCSMQQEIPHKQTRVVEGKTPHIPIATTNYMVPKNIISYSNLSLPTSLGNPGTVAGRAGLFTISKRAEDHKNSQNWEERYIHLQNFLKMCDSESTHNNFIQSELLYYSNITSLLRYVPSKSSFKHL